MAAPGRKPLPKKLHIIKGNPGKRSLDALDRGVSAPVRAPSCPSHLSDEAKREWRRIVPLLKKLGTIAMVDRSSLAAYCQVYGRWVQAEKMVAELGEEGLVNDTQSGYKQLGIWLQIASKSIDQMRRYIAEFGLSPSARTRIQPSPDAGKKPEQDPSDKYF